MSTPWFLTDDVRREFDPTAVRELTPLVRRVTADNPGMMTGPGTNCYLVGRREVAVIDTGMDDPAHVQHLAEAGGGRIRWILITHKHPDHWPGSRRLSEQTGAPVLAHPATLQSMGPGEFHADRHLADGDVLRAAEFTLRCLHTPGHAADHLCFLLEDEGLLFAGDHVMDGSTVVISPPDGDMKEYVESLQRLAGLPLATIAPAHGRLLAEPRTVLETIIEHRLMRERMVVDALRAAPPATIPELVERIYTDVPQALHPVAAHSVYAHLLKLRRERRAHGEGFSSRWSLLP